MRHSVCLMLVLLPTPASTQTLDCERLVRTHVPYELEFKDGSGKVTPFQIYRHDKLYKDQYNPQSNGVLKTTVQTIFATLAVQPDGRTVRYAWSAPTDRYFFDRGELTTHLSMFVDGNKTEDVDYRFRLIDSEKLTVASCVFETKHYVVDIGTRPEPMRTEVWFSPDLQAALRTKLTRFRNDGPQVTTSQATAIVLDFKPLQ